MQADSQYVNHSSSSDPLNLETVERKWKNYKKNE